MRVTIEGTADQVAAAMGLMPLYDAAHVPEANHAPEVKQRRPRGASRLGPRQQIIAKQMRLLREAFDLIRHDPQEQALVNSLARAIGGSAEITPTILDAASQIIAERKRGS